MTSLRYAIRQIWRKPVFTFVVTAMLALGIGATTAMYSLFHGVLLSKLPIREPERLVNLGTPGPKAGGDTTCTMAGDCDQVFSLPMFRDLEAQQTVLGALAGHYGLYANLAYGDQTQSAQALLVSGGYFAALEIRPLLGRLLGPQDDARLGEGAVAVLSHGYWQTSLGADPNAVGRTIVVNGQTLTIVGVAPAGFTGTTLGWNPSVFVPLTMRNLMESNPARDGDRRSYWVYAFGRLKPGVSLEQARAGLNALYSGIINEVEVPLNGAASPETLARFRTREIAVGPGAGGQSLVPSVAGQPIALLLAVTGVVLLIVCVNVANLVLARGAARAGEFAIRCSIGASRMQLVRGLLCESAVLAGLGGLASVPVAVATLRGVYSMMPREIAGGVTIGLSPSVALFAACVSLATILLFGLLPAFHASAGDAGSTMKGQSRQAVGGRGMTRFGSALATTQVVFSMMLLVFAGLFAQSLANLARADLGMNVESLVTFSISPRRNGYSDEQAMQLFDSIERELASQPGVTSVASSMVPLISFANWGREVSIEGRDRDPNADANASRNDVSPSFFGTLSIPLHAGRAFTDADRAGAPRVAIVNEAFVRKFRLEAGALGTRLSVDDTPPNIEIVGVIADAKYSAVRGDAPPQLIFPRRQIDSLGALSYYVRGATTADDLMSTAKRVVAAADRNLPVTGLTTMDRVVETNLFTDRLVALLSGGFAALATLLAATGLYGVIAYSVANRTRELGLRLALGATAGELRTMVLKRVARVALIGMPIGLALGVAMGQAAQALLFGLKGYDPVVLGGAVAVLGGVLLAAGYLPARRASAVTPMEALRYE